MLVLLYQACNVMSDVEADYTGFAPDPLGDADALSSNCSSNCIHVMSAKASVRLPHKNAR